MTVEEFPTISAIIVSFNTRQMTLKCLRALEADLAGIRADVWVVDNGSVDGTAAAIRAEFPQIQLILNDRNVGFGAANNLALRQARGQYFLLLNSDAFPRRGAVTALIEHLDTRPRVAVAGPRLLNEDGSLQQSCFRYPRPAQAWAENLWVSRLFPDSRAVGDFQHWAHDEQREVDFVAGACMLVRREMYEAVGGFDETFFMYAEEADWQRRMRDGGWMIEFTPKAVVTHLGGASGKNDVPRLSRHFFRGLDRYVMKHHGWLGLVSVRLAMMVGCSLRAVCWTAVLAGGSRRRALAFRKLKLHLWLIVRQATHWRLSVHEGVFR